MPDNLLQICKNVADKLQIDRPVTIVNNAEDSARLLLQLARHECEDLTRANEDGWKAQIREHTFQTVNGTADYAKPNDFKYFVDETMWDRDNYWELRGPLTQKEWQNVKSSVLGQSVTPRSRFQLRSDGSATNPVVKFYLDPTPTEAWDMVFEYVTTGYCIDVDDGTVKADWTKDTNTPMLDQYLIELGMVWRYLSRKGLPYEEEVNEYETQRDQAIARDGGARVLSLTSRPQNTLLSTCNIPDTGFGT